MGWKKNLFNKAGSFLCNIYRKKAGALIYLSENMLYDTVKETYISEYPLYDYCRYRTLELVAEEIYKNNVCGNVAEAGVAQGHFAKIINRAFPDRQLYLYDTFEGFDENDKKRDIEKGYTSENFFCYSTHFGSRGVEKNIEIVRSQMKYLDNCEFRQGYFPDSAVNEQEEKFAFVSIDMDLYDPIFAGLNFFYPRLSNGGYIFLHDYNHCEFKGIKVAVENFEKTNGKLSKFPLSDQGGTLIIHKNG